MRVELRADGAAHRAYRLEMRAGADDGAADQIAVSADIFGQRIERQIGAVPQRRLENRAEQRIVAAYDRARALLRRNVFGDAPHERNIDEAVHRIGRRLDENHRNSLDVHCAFGRGADVFFVKPVREADARQAERR